MLSSCWIVLTEFVIRPCPRDYSASVSCGQWKGKAGKWKKRKKAKWKKRGTWNSGTKLCLKVMRRLWLGFFTHVKFSTRLVQPMVLLTRYNSSWCASKDGLCLAVAMLNWTLVVRMQTKPIPWSEGIESTKEIVRKPWRLRTEILSPIAIELPILTVCFYTPMVLIIDGPQSLQDVHETCIKAFGHACYNIYM